MNYARIVLTVAPFIFTIGLIPFVNKVKPIVMGLPFLAFWLCLSIYFTFICILLLFKYDERRKQNGGKKEG